MKRKSSKNFSKIALLFLALSIPLGIYAISNVSNFDTRNQAADLTLDIETCQIRFPYINPSSVEVNKTVQAKISANTPGEAITSLKVMDRTGTIVFSKEYNNGIDKVAEDFTLSPKEVGDFGILGTLITDKGTRPCVVEQKKGVVVVSNNLAPEFKTIPTSAKPSNVIKVKDSYQYQLEATDTENDNINYAFSFTPNAEWLKSTIIENGSNGKLTLKFNGTPDKAGSYMANVFIHDGYNSHLRAQTWVINVDQDKNDVPKVSIISPSTDISVKKNDKLTVSWEAADLNQITKFELYFATNPGNSNTWVAINKNISPKVGNYIVDTKDIPVGKYQFIVTATDNFTPPATGVGFSANVTVGDPVQVGPDDGVVLQEAQIVNVSPSNESSIKNKTAIISATLVPSKDANVKKDSVKIYLDDSDITSKARITEGNNKEYSVLYTPENPYSEGVHKVQVIFEDDKGNKADKSWTFTVIPEDQQDSDVFNIFGFQIPKRIVFIVAAGLAILILALVVPWFLYLAWRGTKDDETDEYEQIYKKTERFSPEPNSFVEETKPIIEVNTVPQKETVTFKPLYSSPKPELTQEVITEPKLENAVEELKSKVEELSSKQTEPIAQPEISPVSIPVVEPTLIPVETPIYENIPLISNTPAQPTVVPVNTVQSFDSSIPTVVDNTQTTSHPEEKDFETDILESTNKQLEELAKKLRAKEEMLDEFIPTQDDSAPSSSASSTTGQNPQ